MNAPAFLRRGGLQARIVVLFMGLLLAVQAASLLLIGSQIGSGARAAVNEDLRTGERVFDRMLRQNARNLTEAAQLLAADYGFRSAVSSGDAGTLASALQNHGERVGASVAIFTDANFKLAAATVDDAQRFVPLLRRVAGAMEAGDNVVLIDGLPYQLVSVPVRAPLLVGWVAMGFRIEEALLRDIGAVASIDVALLTRSGRAGWRVANSTLPASVAADLSSRWMGARDGTGQPRSSVPAPAIAFELAAAGGSSGDHVLATERLLVRDGNDEAVAVLMRSLDAATAPYRRLQWLLFAVTLVAIVAFAIGSVATARRITTPLRVLTASARCLSNGHYDAEVPAEGEGEIGDLARSFESMRHAIQARDAQVRRLAYEDPLTALPNRESFRTLLGHALAAPPAGEARCAVLMLDLDRFKHVNDVLGHPFGDRLLREVAGRLASEALRGEDVLARMGGDEFALLLRGADEGVARKVAERIGQVFATPMRLDHQNVDLGAGIGIAFAPRDGDGADLLIARAEIAMYAAKQQRLDVVAYDASLDSASEESLTLLGELRRAVEHDQLRLWLQPKVELASGQVIGAEALLRWQHPLRGLIPPMRFIPFAEQTGFIRDLTRWIIERGSKVLAELQAAGIDLRLSINLSVRDLLDQDLPDKMRLLAECHATAPVTLCLEITESAIMDDPQRAQQTLEQLHAMGFRLSIDDFGTGYSSLAYLKRLPVDELKIDKSFVLNMEHDLDDAKIVRSVIQLAHNLGLSVVAEGVETETAWKLLQGLGCDEAQGYLIARPMPAEQFADWVTRWSAPRLTEFGLESRFARLL